MRLIGFSFAARSVARPAQLFRPSQLRMLCTSKKSEVATTDDGGKSGELAEAQPLKNAKGEVRVRTAPALRSLIADAHVFVLRHHRL